LVWVLAFIIDVPYAEGQFTCSHNIEHAINAEEVGEQADDIAGAQQLMPDAFAGGTVRLVGSPELTTRYAAGLAARGYRAEPQDGGAASLAGLAHVHEQLYGGPACANA